MIGVVGYPPMTEFGRNLVIGLWVLVGDWEGGGFGKNFGKLERCGLGKKVGNFGCRFRSGIG